MLSELSTSNVMVFPVRVLTKICIDANAADETTDIIKIKLSLVMLLRNIFLSGFTEEVKLMPFSEEAKVSEDLFFIVFSNFNL